MLRQKVLLRCYAYLGLFAILLMVICPLVTQTIALVTKPSENKLQRYTPPSLTHFDCELEFLKENNLDFNVYSPEIGVSQFNNEDSNNTLDEDDTEKIQYRHIVSCGYCDLIHSATLLVAFYWFLFETPSSNTVLVTTNPHVLSLNFWSILTRAPPVTQVMS